MINYAASIVHNGSGDLKTKNVKPIENLYTQALNQKQNSNNANYNDYNYVNEKADRKIAVLLKK
jgi:hypothetical protein